MLLRLLRVLLRLDRDIAAATATALVCFGRLLRAVAVLFLPRVRRTVPAACPHHCPYRDYRR